MNQTLHFSIRGDSLTRHVRDLVCQGEWRHAVHTLIEGLEGMTHELALAVLKGEKRLAGANNDLHDEVETPEARTALQRRYDEALVADTLKWGDKHYRAYALVTKLGYDDFMAGKRRYDLNGRRGFLKHYPGELPEQQAFDLEQALCYADNLQNDIALPVKDADHPFYVWLLLAEDSTAADLPLWMQPNTSVEQLADNGRYRYPVRGYVEPPVVAAEVLEPVPQVPSSATTAQDRRAQKLAEEQREAEYETFVEGVRERVKHFADNDAEYGWHEFKFHHEESGRYLTLKAPKRALMAYSLSRTPGAHLAPEYKPFSEMGMKLGVDNPLHTDVWLGCGFNIDSTVYDHSNLQHIAFMEMMFEMQKLLLGYEFQVLTSGGRTEFYGRIVTPECRDIEEQDILLVPHAGVEFDLPAREAGAIICEVGGKLAHLVTVCREDGKPIVRVPDAMKILRKGMRVTLDLQKGKLDIWSM